MKLFPNGLSGRMIPSGLGAETASDLVRRTLAQHGLGAKGLASSLSSFRQDRAPSTAPQVDGARWAGGAFTCKAGSRDYWLYLPASAKSCPTGLVVMLHGCTQTPQDFAAGTAMNDHAERHGFAVLYPAQARGANAQSCWNWFSKADQRRNRGEPAVLVGMTAQITAEHSIPSKQIFIAGLSAGGAMAVILGETYPEVFSGVGVHSGLPYSAASDVASAFAAMAGQSTKSGVSPIQNRRTSTIVFHGVADATVHPGNGARIAQDALSGAAAQVQTVEKGQTGGRGFTRTLTSSQNGSTVEHWEIAGLAHAWSGGQPAGSYTDVRGPDASAEMVRFFLQQRSEG
jgi:poly(hydroxyalkanoate) depolymerase family esterase